jgi:hypothetical protein
MLWSFVIAMGQVCIVYAALRLSSYAKVRNATPALLTPEPQGLAPLASKRVP